MIEKHQSLVVAESILKRVLNDPSKKKLKQSATVKCYQNGREHGFSIGHQYICVTFCESRGSDTIVVYCGEPSDTSISEVAYKNYKTFPHNQPKEAAKYVVFLLNLILGPLEQMPTYVNDPSRIIKYIATTRLGRGI